MDDLKQLLASYARMMYKRGYSIATEGNISLKISDNEFLITPSKCIKHFIKKEDIVTIDKKGIAHVSEQRASSERFTHLEIYHQNPSARAIVHAHPHYVLLCSSTGLKPFEKPFLIETALFIRNVKYGGFALPSSRDGARAVRDICRDTQAIILEGHGCFTWGDSLEEAFSLLEVMEKTAKMFYEAHVGGLKLDYLTADSLLELEKIDY